MSGLDIGAMAGFEFEVYVAGVLRHKGFSVSFTKATGDFGVDLVAHKGADVVAVQCKRQSKPVGAGAVQQVVAGAAMYQCLSTMVVSNQSFTSAALILAKRHHCRLIDGVELSELAEDWNPEIATDRFALEREPIVIGGPSGGSVRAEELRLLAKCSSNALLAVAIAREEAGELNFDEVRPSHLLLGVLQAAGECDTEASNHSRGLRALFSEFGLTAHTLRARLMKARISDDTMSDEDAAALASIGIDLRAVLDAVARTFGADAFDNARRDSDRRRRRRQITFARSGLKVLELAVRDVLAHKDSEIRCEHLMLGILRAGDKTAIALIGEHVNVAQLRAAVTTLLDQAA